MIFTLIIDSNTIIFNINTIIHAKNYKNDKIII